MAPSNHVRLDVRRLRDESVAQGYKRGLAESLGEPNDSDDSEKLAELVSKGKTKKMGAEA